MIERSNRACAARASCLGCVRSLSALNVLTELHVLHAYQIFIAAIFRLGLSLAAGQHSF